LGFPHLGYIIECCLQARCREDTDIFGMGGGIKNHAQKDDGNDAKITADTEHS
jgi:hypothetical protein